MKTRKRTTITFILAAVFAGTAWAAQPPVDGEKEKSKQETDGSPSRPSREKQIESLKRASQRAERNRRTQITPRQVSKGTGITSGCAVAYGHFISPPYSIEFEGGKLLINGVQDAEAAMALSLGKPVIFFCDEERRGRFYREVHPLSRLIDFNTGVPVGAMVTSSIEQVSILLYRLFENQMEYELDRTHSGSLRLKEKLTDSVVRLQTNSTLLRETFFNYYNRARRGQPGAIWPSLYL